MRKKQSAHGVTRQTIQKENQTTEILNKTARLADRALSEYGEPALSLEELRTALEKQCSAGTLTEQVLHDRAAGW